MKLSFAISAVLAATASATAQPEQNTNQHGHQAPQNPAQQSVSIYDEGPAADRKLRGVLGSFRHNLGQMGAQDRTGTNARNIFGPTSTLR